MPVSHSPTQKRLLPYLKKLGIGDFYASPIFEARPGSMHGYDVTRHDRLNPELGGDEGFARFAAAAARATAWDCLLDIVPNHMGVGNDSVWWQDVLENGRASQYASYFDIDWNPLNPDMKDKLLLPILGGQYGDELEAKRIQVALARWPAASAVFRSPDAHRPALHPDDFSGGRAGRAGRAAELSATFCGTRRTFRRTRRPTRPWCAQRRQQLAELHPRLRAALESPEMQPAIQRALERINGVEGDPRSFDRLHELLEQQP